MIIIRFSFEKYLIWFLVFKNGSQHQIDKVNYSQDTLSPKLLKVNGLESTILMLPQGYDDVYVLLSHFVVEYQHKRFDNQFLD